VCDEVGAHGSTRCGEIAEQRRPRVVRAELEAYGSQQETTDFAECLADKRRSTVSWTGHTANVTRLHDGDANGGNAARHCYGRGSPE
jgi:hypothetical protein